eukprot:TRINITY_DN30136_c0_g1_i1.p1 TRINITY_DN30136_c0_g1~~TRINITY_DN30136_c0_g1_i1.p1  ORF type:complete len:288 (+),score=37.96 TRINITY_DN30136_c0_g1_i1:70-933(+)
MPSLLFENHDGCGDYWFEWGTSPLRLQLVNTATNVFFVWAGLSLAFSCKAAETRCNGVLLTAVGWFSAVYHATSSWGGFLLDIAAMACWATHLIVVCQGVCAALAGTDPPLKGSGTADLPGSRAPPVRVLALAVVLGATALTLPFVSYEAFGASPRRAWDFWANSFLVLIIVAAVPALHAAFRVGLLPSLQFRVIAAIVVILVGVVFTQLIHLWCVPGLFTKLPLHSMWHLCAALSAKLTVGIADSAFLAAAAGGPSCHAGNMVPVVDEAERRCGPTALRSRPLRHD